MPADLTTFGKLSNLAVILRQNTPKMEFEEYLKQKKIDIDAFQKSDLNRFEEWNILFKTMHPDSFTAQKKFLINDIRRRYLLNETKQN